MHLYKYVYLLQQYVNSIVKQWLTESPLNLEDMPMNDGPAWIVYHLPPVFGLGPLPSVSQDDATDRVAATDSVVVAYRQLQVYSLGYE